MDVDILVVAYLRLIKDGNFMQLLAKALKEDKVTSPGETLTGHTSMVITAFKAMYGTPQNPTHLALQWLQFFKLPVEKFEDFWLHGLVACALHDTGKANEDFQQLVKKTLVGAQRIRHEQFSGLFLYLPECREWLESIQGLDLSVIFSAVVGHHLKIKEENFATSQNLGSLIQVYPHGVQAIFNLLAHHLNLPQPKLQIPEYWDTDDSDFGESISNLKEKIEDELHHYDKKILKTNPERSAFLNAVRTALILADSAGSGLSREMREEAKLGQAIENWLHSVFPAEGVQSAEDIENKVIAPRIQQIRDSGKSFKWGDFQLAAADLPQRTLLLAPCGSGKTLAAWKWIQAQLGRQPRSRVIFLYPTRATATEGFRDYVSWAPEADAALLHGTSAYELEGLFSNPEDKRAEKDFTTEDRLYAVGYWQRRIFSATVDQFLGFMQYVYRSVCLLPLLVDSVVVIDEVHSFDHSLFSALKKFLKHFDIPVLCMTASLPPERQKQLKECGLEIFPQNASEFEDLTKRSELPRYQIHVLQKADVLDEIVQSGLEAGKRILWVVNTVDRCQALAQKWQALCYHSRFKLDDRKVSHSQVISAFQQKQKGLIAITTQVCEMSLDLDADILISEIAPIPALIQRMGRSNRHATEAGSPLGDVYIYPPEQILPYKKEDLTGVEAFLAELNDKAISQTDLENGLERYGSQEAKLDKYSAFLESGPWACSADHHLRDSLDLSEQAILDTEIDRFFAMRLRKEPIDGLILPAPKKMARTEPRLNQLFLKVVSASDYSSVYGLLKTSQEVLS